MKKAIEQNELAKQKCEVLNKQIEESYLNIHGHTLFNFLGAYLAQIHSKSFRISLNDDNYMEIINSITIEMQIVYGDGSVS